MSFRINQTDEVKKFFSKVPEVIVVKKKKAKKDKDGNPIVESKKETPKLETGLRIQKGGSISDYL